MDRLKGHKVRPRGEFGQMQTRVTGFIPLPVHGILLQLCVAPLAGHAILCAGHADGHDGKEQRQPSSVEALDDVPMLFREGGLKS